jgi:ADP-heptose:LPS heptosyltransferase
MPMPMPTPTPGRLMLGEAPRIAVFRALVLGDLLCAVPALRALRKAWPRSELTLIGLPWAAALAERLPQVDRFVEFPGYPGLPERTPDLAALPAFLQEMQHSKFDLLLQLHGSGGIVNPLVAACGARHTAGFVTADGYSAEPALHAPWPTTGHEIERLLALTDHLGVPRDGMALEFPLREEDRHAVAQLWPGVQSARPFACIHPGAQLPSRRWAPERFAAIGDLLAARGYEIVITGTAAEAPLADAVARSMRYPAVSLVGKTSLWTLGALIERSRLLVCNDTGVSHVAAALGTPSVVVSLGADVARWAPLDRSLHRVVWRDMPCRPCGHAVCPHGHGCSNDLRVDEVAAAVLAATGLQPPVRPLGEPRKGIRSLSITPMQGTAEARSNLLPQARFS